MFPRLAQTRPGDRNLRRMELDCERGLSLSIGVSNSDVSYVGFRELCPSVIRPSNLVQHLTTMCRVLRSRHPFQVALSIVRLISVTVIHLLTLRSLPMEGCADKDGDSSCDAYAVYAEHAVLIPTPILRGLQDSICSETSYAPVAADLVLQREPLYRLPALAACFRRHVRDLNPRRSI